MKNPNYIIRLSILVIIGMILTYMTYQFKYSTFFFDSIIYGTVILIGLIFLIWTLFIDLELFRTKKDNKYLLTFIVGVFFIGTVLIINWHINSNFDKPTLLKVFYDGDYNGSGIDFKTDGTYIFDNSAIGLSDYHYGTYKIDGNNILLDQSEIDRVIKSELLEIKEKEVEFHDEIRKESYVYQISKNGEVLKNETKFRVVIDNRNN